MSRATPIIEGTQVNSVWNEGETVTEVFKITGITGATPAEKRFNALSATGLPQIGEQHPVVPSTFLSQIAISALGADDENARATCTYRPLETGVLLPRLDIDPGTVFTSVTLQEIETRFDQKGEQILLRRTVTNTDGTDETQTQAASVILQVPLMTLGWVKRESFHPADKAREYVGKVNLSPIWDEDERRWLCTRIDGDSQDNGQTYDVTYEFQRSMLLRYGGGLSYSSWDSLVVFEEDGRAIEDPTVGTALKIVQHYEAVDFRRLGLTL